MYPLVVCMSTASPPPPPPRPPSPPFVSICSSGKEDHFGEWGWGEQGQAEESFPAATVFLIK